MFICPILISLNFKFISIAPLFGYSFSWTGHFLFEKNKPAAFTNPLLALKSDFILWFDATKMGIKKVFGQAA